MRAVFHVAPWLIGLSVLSAACGGDLPSATSITSTRVIAAKVKVVGDEKRATPRRNEFFSVEWSVVTNGQDAPNLYSAYLACKSAPSRAGIPFCLSAPFSGFRSESTLSTHVFNAQIPDESAYAPGDVMLVYGAWCTSGQPQIDLGDNGNGSDAQSAALTSVRCENSTETPLKAVLEIIVGAEGFDNSNPSWDDQSVALSSGLVWPPISAEVSAVCGDEAVPTFETGTNVVLNLSLSSSTRDTYLQNGEPPAVMPEELTISSFTTAGSFDVTFKVIESTDQNERLSTENTWLLPSDATVEGEVVRFYFVVRDGRGGTDIIERKACLKAKTSDGS